MSKITKCILEKVCGLDSKLLVHNKNEYVLCGRSNVGKSSFINAICNRENYARISKTPGKTRTINYYLVNDKFYLVDLPGYGYAKVSIYEQNKWATFINKYFEKSQNIEEIMLLVDIRHSPTKDDIDMFQWILNNTGYEPIIIATKCDKIKKTEIKKNIEMIKDILLTSEKVTIIPFSSKTKEGVREVLTYLS